MYNYYIRQKNIFSFYFLQFLEKNLMFKNKLKKYKTKLIITVVLHFMYNVDYIIEVW